jgi:uncharacterized membrane-anchored protein YitT (DUF2179 family)
MHEITHLPFGILKFSLNLPFLFLGKRLLENICHPKFDHILLIAAANDFVQIDAVTTDNLLIALFGGCLIGIGMGLCIRSGSTADGVEILSC